MLTMRKEGVVSIRTTVTLDEDVVERLEAASRARGRSVDETMNGLLRSALGESNPFGRTLKIEPLDQPTPRVELR